MEFHQVFGIYSLGKLVQVKIDYENLLGNRTGLVE